MVWEGIRICKGVTPGCICEQMSWDRSEEVHEFRMPIYWESSWPASKLMEYVLAGDEDQEAGPKFFTQRGR